MMAATDKLIAGYQRFREGYYEQNKEQRMPFQTKSTTRLESQAKSQQAWQNNELQVT